MSEDSPAEGLIINVSSEISTEENCSPDISNDFQNTGNDKLIQLRRKETGTQWGFRIQGGLELGTLVFIYKVTRNSIAHRCGLRSGDGLLMIRGKPADRMTHSQAKMEIIRAGNELDFYVRRKAVDVSSQSDQKNKGNSVEEEHSTYEGFTDPKVQSRSFKILQQYLEAADEPVS